MDASNQSSTAQVTDMATRDAVPDRTRLAFVPALNGLRGTVLSYYCMERPILEFKKRFSPDSPAMQAEVNVAVEHEEKAIPQ